MSHSHNHPPAAGSEPFEYTLPDGQTLRIAVHQLPALEAAIRAWRHHKPRARDLVAEIRDYLAHHPGTSALEIARGIKARDRDVRETLHSNNTFLRLTPPSGRSRHLHAWALASQSQRSRPTTRDEYHHGPQASGQSRGHRS